MSIESKTAINQSRTVAVSSQYPFGQVDGPCPIHLLMSFPRFFLLPCVLQKSCQFQLTLPNPHNTLLFIYYYIVQNTYLSIYYNQRAIFKSYQHSWHAPVIGNGPKVSPPPLIVPKFQQATESLRNLSYSSIN